jgi:hypothetical protein
VRAVALGGGGAAAVPSGGLAPVVAAVPGGEVGARGLEGNCR